MNDKPTRRVLITGGTGFIGARLCPRLAEDGWSLTVLTRRPERARQRLPAGTDTIVDFDELPGDTVFDAVINLAGEGIADKRWTAQRKAELEASRVDLTHRLIAWLSNAQQRPGVLVSGSAIGWYGDAGDRELRENDMPGHTDYAHDLCARWEQEAQRAKELGIRTCLLRTGVVVGRDGGFLQRMLPPFRFGLGGPIGSGRQWMSWIHREDLVGMIVLLLERADLEGVFNGTAPSPVTNREFSRTLGRVLHRPAVLPVPPPVLEFAFGEMANLLTGGQRVLPGRIADAGYDFLYPDLEGALRQAVT